MLMRFFFCLAAASLLLFAAPAPFSGKLAMDHTTRAVAFGPRPAGSAANTALQGYIIQQLKANGCTATAKCEVIEDAFRGNAPSGPVPMKNILAHFKGTSGKVIAVSGHFDTKYYPGRRFVGASDGASSTGLLLELTRVAASRPHTDDLYIVFFDGEEAFGDWTATDSLYGSRHLAEKWKADGTLAKLKGLINVDMIGDSDLNLRQETNGDPKLRALVWNTAAEMGFQANFLPRATLATDDDHMPFVRMGAPAIDIIDFDYPPWHTDDDTLDKVSARSLEIVGSVVAESIRRLEIAK